MIISSHYLPIQLNPSTTPKNHVDQSQEQSSTSVNAADKTPEATTNKPTNSEASDQGQQTDKENTSVTHPQSENTGKHNAESELNQQQISQLRELRQRDREVRAHEQAHGDLPDTK